MAITRNTAMSKHPQHQSTLPPPFPPNNEQQQEQQQQDQEQEEEQQQEQEEEEEEEEEEVVGERGSNYEQTREQRIKENRERLQKLGIVDLSLQLKSIARTPRRTPTSDRRTPLKSPSVGPPQPRRRSSRLQNAPPVTYTEPKEEKTKRSRDIWMEEGDRPEFYTEEHEKLLGHTELPWTLYIDGYRADGTRIYDPVNGKTCHQCRQKTLGQRTHCCKCNLVQGQFCGDCLYTRYGEHVVEATQNPDWVCPPCRGICNCSLCRQAKGWPATGYLYRKVNSLGYKSVAHYLIMTKRAPPDSEKNSDAPQSAKRLLPFEGMELPNDNDSDDKAMVGSNEINTESENNATAVGESDQNSVRVGRSRKKLKKESTDAGEKPMTVSEAAENEPVCNTKVLVEMVDSATTVGESDQKSAGVGRPRKNSKIENVVAGEKPLTASVTATVEAEPLSAGVGRPRKNSKIENVVAGEKPLTVSATATAEAEPVSNTNGPTTSTSAADKSNSKQVVRWSTRSSKKENVDVSEESLKTSGTPGVEPVSSIKGPNNSESKADSVGRRSRSRNKT